MPNLTIDQRIDTWFRYHPATEAQARAYEEIRSSARQLARVIVAHTPSCADQTAALRKLREVVMTANAAIACEGV
ncbi:MAG: hypothetical protein M9894_16075 [Planctomycetes bacterium]|nr:hypothetical protein [Planctomycetota bacterium]